MKKRYMMWVVFMFMVFVSFSLSAAAAEGNMKNEIYGEEEGDVEDTMRPAAKATDIEDDIVSQYHEPVVLSEGIETVLDAAKGDQYFTFTPAESGTYFIMTDGYESAEHSLYRLDGESDYTYLASWYDKLEMEDRASVYLNKGTAYTYYISSSLYTPNIEKAPFKVKIYRKAVADWKIKKAPLDLEIISGKDTYSLNGMEITVILSDGSEEIVYPDTQLWYSYGFMSEYAGNYEYYQRLGTVMSAGKQPVAITMAPEFSDKAATLYYDVKKMRDIVDLDCKVGSIPVAINSKETKYLRFIPEKTGVYTIFSNSRTADPYLELYDEDGIYLNSSDDTEEDSNFNMVYNFVKGYPYILAVRNYNAIQAETYDVIIKEGGTVEKAAFKSGILRKGASCVMPGIMYFEARDEKWIKTEEIPATGVHDFGSYVTTQEATAIQEGIQTRICTKCGEKQVNKISRLSPFINLGKSSIVLKVNQTAKAVGVSMQKGDFVKSWSVDNSKIATVDKQGKITGKKVGNTKITVTLASGLKKSITVQVQKGKIKTTKVKLRKKKVTLKKKKTYNIKATKVPANSTQKLTYTSSNKKVVTVSKKGKVTAKAKGNAKVTVKSGNKKAVLTVKVK